MLTICDRTQPLKSILGVRKGKNNSKFHIFRISPPKFLSVNGYDFKITVGGRGGGTLKILWANIIL